MDVRVVFIFAVVVLAPIFVTAQNQQSGAKSGQKTQEANPAVPISVNCNCTSQAADSKDKPQGWHKLVTWPEGIATWALILTLFAIGWQSWETRRAAEAAKKSADAVVDSERAWITAKVKEIRHGLNVDHIPIEEGLLRRFRGFV